MSRKKNKGRKRRLSSGNKRLIKRSVPLKKSSFDILGKLRKALQYHQTGQLCKAEEIYKRILEINPNHSDSLHLLGVIAHQAGKSNIAADLINKAIQNNPKNPVYYYNLGYVFIDQGNSVEAISCYQKAVEIKPDYAAAYNNMGNAFQDQGNFVEAISCYQKAVNIMPDYADAYNNMGNAFRDQGNSVEAISCYKKALQIKPDFAEAYNNLGYAFRDQGNSVEAISCYQKAVEIKPDFAEAYNNLGYAFRDQGNFVEAISCYQKALEIQPDYAAAYNNMGNAFRNQGRLLEAISCYQKALEIQPDFAVAYNNMGNAFQDQGNFVEAISCYQKALNIMPDYAGACTNMGNAFRKQGKLDEAISCYQKALQIKPDYAAAYTNMGNAFQDQGNSVEAISCYQKAGEIQPDFAEPYSELFHQLQRTCTWQRLQAMTAKFDSLTKKALDSGKKSAESPFISLSRHTDLSRNLAIASSWSYDIARAMSNLNIRFSFDGRRSSKTKIAIGYLSNDFRDHPMAHLMGSLFGLHNRDEFEILCYSYGQDDGSHYRERIQRDCDKFVDLRNLDHPEAARCIYEDQVDILVDLKGYTGGGRLEICGLCPAPIQVRYLGLAGTTGAEFFDYIITDKIVTPKDHAPYYSENFVYVPHCYQVNDHAQVISEKDWKRVDFGLPEGGLVFCSFNQGYKIEPVMFDSWMNILRRVPKGVLWLQRIGETAERNLRQEGQARGVSSERLIFAERLPKDQHLARLRLADMALDTRIVSGAATTSDSLWAGVPVITLQGSNFASRMSSSILTAIGLPELVTHTLEDYEALAVQLALDPAKLQTIRQRLAKNRSTEPLFDTQRFAKNLEKAYKEMWEIFVTGKRPRQVAVVES